MIFKISKSEALILSAALNESKYEMVKNCHAKAEALAIMKKLNDLERRLDEYATDGRMQGRRKTWHFLDRLRWWVFGTDRLDKLPKDPPLPPVVVREYSEDEKRQISDYYNMRKAEYDAQKAAPNQLDMFKA